MRYQYGAYTHDEGTVELLAVLRQKQYSPRGRPAKIRITHQCQGELLATAGLSNADQQTELRDKIQFLVDAYKIDGQNAGLLHNDGSRSVHYIQDSQTLSGVKVQQPPQFPDGSGAEYSSFRSFAFSLYADYLAFEWESLYDFKESLTFTGSGRKRYAVTELDTGTPDVQQVSQWTPQTIVQSGSAVGIGSYPIIPSPIYGTGSVYQGPRSSVTYGAVTKLGNANWLFPVSWNYIFISPAPLSGTPNIR